jgi:hypothetical protein
MIKMIRKVFVLLFFAGFLLTSYSSDVTDRLQSIKAEDYPGSELVVVFDSTHSDVQETGLTYVNMHRLYKVFTPSGALRMSVVKIDYDPLSAWVDIKKVLVHKADGSTREVSLDIYDYPAPARAIYWGASEKMVEVGRLEPGDAVEVWLFRKGFTYALLAGEGDDDMYIPPMKGHFYDIVHFYSNDPIIEKVYQALVPADKPMQYEFYNGEVRSSVTRHGDKMLFTFSKEDIRPLKREPGMVSFSDVAPKLLMSTSPDWYAKSTWFYGVNEDYGSFEYTPEIKDKVSEIVKGAQDEWDSISRLTHWCADEIRYSGISMGPGEGYTLHSGDMTFTDRCGVCKDKAGMLITMLRAAGFESYAAMTMAGSRIDYIPADQFNHSVTVVKASDGQYHLLDPTWVPFLRELWSSAEQQQNYLMGLPEGADLAITPISPPENHYIKMKGTAALQEDGTLEGEIIIEAEGQSDASIRRMFTSWYKNQWDNNLERELKRVHPGARMISAEYHNPYDYMKGPINIVLRYSVPDYALTSGDIIFLKSFIANSFFKRAMSHLYANTSMETRKYPFRDRCSRLVELEETISLPGSFEFISKPEGEPFSDEIASADCQYILSDDGKTLKMKQELSFGKRIYDASDWPSYRKAVMQQMQFAEEPVILEKNK